MYTKIDGTTKDDAEDLDLVLPTHNSIATGVYDVIKK